MNRILKWTIGTIIGLGTLSFLIFAFIEGREELARERERERPIKVAPKISRTAEGELIITLDMDTQKRISLDTVALESKTVRPEVAAYGRLQEDPAASFVVRAPITGVVRTSSGRNWPTLGESLSDGISIGSVEPRLAPIERVDLAMRLSDARAGVEAAEARFSTARLTFERARALNADNKNVSDRAVQEAESAFKADEAQLGAARRNITELEAASSSQAAGISPMPLIVARGGEVVEILARPNEAVESGQPLLRVTRFDRLLARVDVVAGEIVDRAPASARIAVVGREDQPMTGQRISLAQSVDPTTLGEGFVFRLSGAPASLRPGTAVIAYLSAPGAAEEAVVVPYSAVVRFGGKAWVYRQLADDKFSRREIAADRSNDTGFVVTQGLKAGERLVVRGAQLLLSEEQKSQIQILEEAEGK